MCNNTTFGEPVHELEKICQCELILAAPIRRQPIVLEGEGGATDSTSSANVGGAEGPLDTLALEDDDAIKREWDKGFVTPDTWAKYVANNAIHESNVKSLR